MAFLKNKVFFFSFIKLAKQKAGGRYSPPFHLHLNNKMGDREREKILFHIMLEDV